MRKNVLILFVLLTSFSYSQTLSLAFAKKSTASYYPIKYDRAYSAIINTTIDKYKLIDFTKSFFLLEGLADSLELETVEYDENLAEYRLTFGFKQGQSLTKRMGAAMVNPAVKLYFDAIFSFNNEKQMQVTFTNFFSDVLVRVDEDGYLNSYKGGKADGKQYEPVLSADKVLGDEAATIFATQTGAGKAMLWANGGLDMLNKATRGDFRKNLYEQFVSYETAIKEGSMVWIYKENIDNYKMSTVGVGKYFDQQKEKFEVENFVFAVDNDRWDNYFELNFNYFIREMARLVSGEVESVALDAEIKFENVDGRVLPIDKKERKTWLKKDIQF